MGFVAPQVTGLIINHHNDMHHWNIVFYIAAGVGTLGNLVFIIFGTAKEQEWNRIKGEGARQAVKEEEEEKTTEMWINQPLETNVGPQTPHSFLFDMMWPHQFFLSAFI